MVLLKSLGNQLAILENNQLTLQLRVYANVSVLAVSSIPTGVALCAKIHGMGILTETFVLRL